MHIDYDALAREDLSDIWLYIAEDDPTRATDYVYHIEKRLENLAVFPRMGHPVEEIENDLWAFPLDDYLIFYDILENGIRITRILHAKRDINMLFFGDTE